MKEKCLNIGLLLLTITLLACAESSDERLDVDVSDVNVSIDFQRLDRDLMQGDTNNLAEFNRTMIQKYGTFWTDYAAGVLGQGNPHDPMFPDNFKAYLQRPYIDDVLRAVDSSYGSETPYKAEIISAFKHLKYHFKDCYTPTVIYACNFFNYACVATDSVLNVGLDFYLGPDHWIVDKLPGQQFPVYMKEEMDPQYLVVDAMSIWFETNFLGEREFDEMLEAMVFFGKLMYALDAMMPEVPKHIKMKYTEDEMSWCVSNEQRIWLTMVERDLVRTTDVTTIRNFFNNAPFTSGLKGDDAPARVGVFMGWQIVRDYMDEHKDISVKELIEETNHQKILNSYSQGKRE